MKNSASEYLPGPEEGAIAPQRPEISNQKAVVSEQRPVASSPPAAGEFPLEASEPLRLGEFDPQAEEVATGEAKTIPASQPPGCRQHEANAPVLRVFSLTEVLNYEPPAGKVRKWEDVVKEAEEATVMVLVY